MENEKPKSIMTELQEEMLGSFVEGALPKIKGFIAPAMKKFQEYLGKNEKRIMIQQLPNGTPMVFILDNTKGKYEIIHDAEKGTDSFTGSKDPSPILAVYDVMDFMQKLMTGDLMKEISNKD